MSAEPARPGPLDSLQRGLRSLRANWQLAPLVALQSLLTLGLTLAGLVILLTGLGVSLVAWLRDLGPGWHQQLAGELVRGLESAPGALVQQLALPLLAATLVWSLAFGIYCYLQAGVLGVLVEAELGAGAALPSWRSFRRFSLSRFDAQGRRLFWRYFWFNHLLAAVVLVWMVLALALVALAARLATGTSVEAGIAIGCVGLVPLGLLLLAAALWSMLATVEVARPGARVWVASRRALRTLRHRLGPVLLIWLMALGGWMILSAAMTPMHWALALGTGDRLWPWLAGRGGLMLIETLANSALVVALVATLTAFLVPRAAAVAAEARG